MYDEPKIRKNNYRNESKNGTEKEIKRREHKLQGIKHNQQG